jgi:hypothetical protein
MDVSAITIAVISAVGPTVAVGVLAWLNSRANKANTKAQLAAAELVAKVAADNAIATLKQQQANANAQQAALEAAKQLVEVAKTTSGQLTHISDTGDATHKIVNNQRTVMLRVVAALAQRIATENPNDVAAQRAALEAAKDLKTTEAGS